MRSPTQRDRRPRRPRNRARARSTRPWVGAHGHERKLVAHASPHHARGRRTPHASTDRDRCRSQKERQSWTSSAKRPPCSQCSRMRRSIRIGATPPIVFAMRTSDCPGLAVVPHVVGPFALGGSLIARESPSARIGFSSASIVRALRGIERRRRGAVADAFGRDSYRPVVCHPSGRHFFACVPLRSPETLHRTAATLVARCS
jgi:hypothetical protein